MGESELLDEIRERECVLKDLYFMRMRGEEVSDKISECVSEIERFKKRVSEITDFSNPIIMQRYLISRAIERSEDEPNKVSSEWIERYGDLFRKAWEHGTVTVGLLEKELYEKKGLDPFYSSRMAISSN